MISQVRPFNINLWTTFVLALVASLAAGCASHRADAKEKKYSKHDQASLRLYLEVNPDGSDRNEPISIGREHPFTLNVEKKAFLTEFNVERASVIDSLGGFSLSIHYDK